MTPIHSLLGSALPEIERRAALVEDCTAGKLAVEFNLKDGKWTLGNISLTFPRQHGGRRPE